MNANLLLAALAAGTVNFILGWLVWVDAMKGYYTDHVNAIPGLYKIEMSMPALLLSNLVGGVIIAWALFRMQVTTVSSGLVHGLVIGILIGASLDLFLYSMTNMFLDRTILLVDIVLNGAIQGACGAIVGLILGANRKVA